MARSNRIIHGTARAYRYGHCRCPDCTWAVYLQRKDERERAKQRRAAGITPAPRRTQQPGLEPAPRPIRRSRVAVRCVCGQLVSPVTLERRDDGSDHLTGTCHCGLSAEEIVHG